MKLNWPTMIVISFAAFIVFILSFVVLTFTDKRFDHDLVTENYYGKELLLQDEINQQQQAFKLRLNPTIETTSEGIAINFPPHLAAEKVVGKVSLYRPSNRRLDFEIPISLSSSFMLIPDSMLVDGRWDLTVDWKVNGEKLLYKKSIFY